MIDMSLAEIKKSAIQAKKYIQTKKLVTSRKPKGLAKSTFNRSQDTTRIQTKNSFPEILIGALVFEPTT